MNLAIHRLRNASCWSTGAWRWLSLTVGLQLKVFLILFKKLRIKYFWFGDICCFIGPTNYVVAFVLGMARFLQYEHRRSEFVFPPPPPPPPCPPWFPQPRIPLVDTIAEASECSSEFLRYLAPQTATTRHKVGSQAFSIIPDFLSVLQWTLSPSGRDALGQGTRVPQKQTRKNNFFYHSTSLRLWQVSQRKKPCDQQKKF